MMNNEDNGHDGDGDDYDYDARDCDDDSDDAAGADDDDDDGPAKEVHEARLEARSHCPLPAAILAEVGCLRYNALQGDSSAAACGSSPGFQAQWLEPCVTDLPC